MKTGWTNRIGRLARLFALLMAVLYANRSECQSIIKCDVPRYLCYGDTIFVSFGTDSTNTIVISTPEATLGHRDTLFLPDGVNCPPMGCSYISSVVFDNYAEGETVTSVENIRYLRIRMEHSWIGDLFIRLECPNGQDAVVLRFGGSPNSECASNIPGSYRGWQNGNNVNLGAFLGIPYDAEDANAPCDASSFANHPGIGMSYCWSNNSTAGIEYASGDGIIYRYRGDNDGTIPGSNANARTNFYHPDESFSNLVGCPLNGSWSIEVMDGWTLDNGYVFGWDLSLYSLTMDYSDCVFDSFAVHGLGAEQVGADSFLIISPDYREYDTSILYSFYAYDTCGRILDTSVWVTYMAPRHTFIEQECVENNLPYVFLDSAFYESATDVPFYLSNWVGCDSIVHFSLTVWLNSSTVYDTVVCDVSLPLEWHGHLFDGPDTVSSMMLDSHGADSLVVYRLQVQKSDTTECYAKICSGKPYTWIDGRTYYDDGETACYSIPSDGLCDSVFRLHVMTNTYTAAPHAFPNPVGLDNSVVTLSDMSSSASRLWSYLDVEDTSRISRFAFPFSADSVAVYFVGQDGFGCRDSTTIVVYSDYAMVWAPNVFTPDEQTNNQFRILSNKVVGGTVSIFTRSGILVTEFDALTGSWNGMNGSTPCPQGTYVWKMSYFTEHNSAIEHVRVGTVTLLR